MLAVMELSELTTVRDLVLDSVKSFERQVQVTDADVLEGGDVDGGPALLIRLKVRSHPEGAAWTETRLRLSQCIRDELIGIGDDRYPILLMYSDSEWPKRDK